MTSASPTTALCQAWPPTYANGDVLYAFGNMTTTADNQSNNNAFVVQVVARVADVPAKRTARY